MPERFKVSKSEETNNYKYGPSTGDGVNQKLLSETHNIALKKNNVSGLYIERNKNK